MEPEGSLPHSQVPATCHRSEPAQSSPRPPSHFLKIHLHIILPSTPKPSKWPFSLTFPHQNPICSFTLPHTCYMPHPSPSWFDHPNTIWWRILIKLLIMLFSPLLILKHLQPTFLHQCQQPSFTLIQNNILWLYQLYSWNKVEEINTNKSNSPWRQCRYPHSITAMNYKLRVMSLTIFAPYRQVVFFCQHISRFKHLL